jgi:hypothetical protein
MNDTLTPKMQEYYEYLDLLRESGVTNMFGAGPYLQEAFELSKYEAKNIVLSWMESFASRHHA